MGKSTLLILFLLVAGCTTTPPLDGEIQVTPPAGYTVYCNKYPDRPECGAK